MKSLPLYIPPFGFKLPHILSASPPPPPRPHARHNNLVPKVHELFGQRMVSADHTLAKEPEGSGYEIDTSIETSWDHPLR